ncbi:MAG: tetratricopeptide repeat protein, partial [Gemmataceae bacterium]
MNCIPNKPWQNLNRLFSLAIVLGLIASPFVMGHVGGGGFRGGAGGGFRGASYAAPHSFSPSFGGYGGYRAPTTSFGGQHPGYISSPRPGSVFEGNRSDFRPGASTSFDNRTGYGGIGNRPFNTNIGSGTQLNNTVNRTQIGDRNTNIGNRNNIINSGNVIGRQTNIGGGNTFNNLNRTVVNAPGVGTNLGGWNRGVGGWSGWNGWNNRGYWNRPGWNNWNRPWAGNYGWYHGGWYGWGAWPAFWGGVGLGANLGLGTGLIGTNFVYSNPYYVPVSVPVPIDTGGPVVISNSSTGQLPVSPSSFSIPPELDYSRPLNIPKDEEVEKTDADVTKSAQQHLDLGREAFKKGDYATAQKEAEVGIHLLPGDANLHEFRALCQFATKKYKDSAATLYAVLAAGPGWDWNTLSSFYSDSETYTKQLRALENWVR